MRTPQHTPTARFPRLLACACLALAATGLAAEHRTGLVIDPADPARTDLSIRRAPLRTSRTDLPRQAKNWLYLPAVNTQQLNNCGAYAPTYYCKTYQEAREHGWERPSPAANPERIMSPGFTFPLINLGQNSGASVSGTMRIIAVHGCATWDDMPETSDYATWPTETVFRRALPYRAQSVFGIDISTEDGILALKEHLAGGDLAVVSLRVHTDVEDIYPSDSVGCNNGVIFARGTTIRDPHALTAIGYDDDRAYNDGTGPKSGAFLAVNSWGTDWGVADPDVGTGGFVWLGYDFVRTLCSPVDIAWCMTDRTAYQPHAFALVGFSHDRCRDLTAAILGGDRNQPNWSLEFFPAGAGYLPYHGTIVVDLSDFTDGHDSAYWLTVSDMAAEDMELGGPVPAVPVTGRVTRFAVQRDLETPRESPDAPADTVDWRWTVPPPWPRTDLYIGDLQPVSPALAGLVPATVYDTAWGDVDNDGDPDLAVCGADMAQPATDGYQVRLYLTSGGAPDSGQTLVTGPRSRLSWADIDNSGGLDLVVLGPQPAVLLNDGLGALVASPLQLPPVAWARAAWADYDNDGWLDVAIAGYTPGITPLFKLLRNDGGKAFVDSGLRQSGTANDLAWGDLDADGWQDLVVCSWGDSGSAVSVLWNDQAAFTRSVRVANSGDAVAVGDVDNDGRLDLAVSPVSAAPWPDPTCKIRVFQNLGNESFGQLPVDIEGLYSARLLWCDMDSDGLRDLIATGHPIDAGSVLQPAVARVYRNLGDGGFVNTGVRLSANYSPVLATADLDGDGDADLLAGGVLYRNAVDALRPNTPPLPPVGLTAQARRGLASLQWQPGRDAETPAAGLAYNLRIGTGPGGNDVLSGVVGDGTAGALRSSHLSPDQLGYVLTGLPAPDRVWHWSVQAVDAAGVASAWSEERKFDANGERPDPPMLPTRLGGLITVDGVALTADTATGCELRVLRTDGRPVPGAVWADVLNPAGWYQLDLPVDDAGGEAAGLEVVVRAFRGDRPLTVLSPWRGELLVQERGTVRRLDLQLDAGPYLTATVPADNATGVVPGAMTLRLVFNEPVVVGSGAITLRQHPDTLVESIPVTDPRVSVAGASVSVTPSTALVGGTHYFVCLERGCFVSATDAPFAGLLYPSDWDFQTRQVSTEYVDRGAIVVAEIDIYSTWQFGGIAVDGAGNVVVANRRDAAGNDLQTIRRYDAAGALVREWGGPGSAPGQFEGFGALGVALDSAGNVYVTDQYNDRVQAFDADGQFLRQWGSLGSGDSQFNRVHSVAVDGDDNVYVTDMFNYRVQKFDTNGSFLLAWGSRGTGDGQFDYPTWIAADAAGRIYVAEGNTSWTQPELDNPRIQVFTGDGQFITKWGGKAAGDAQFMRIAGLAVGPGGEVYASDSDMRCIKVFTADGQLLRAFDQPSWVVWIGEEPPMGQGWPRMPNYDAIAVGRDGTVYLEDSRYGVVRRFRCFQSDDQVAEPLRLSAGWNLVSVPLNLDDPSLGHLLNPSRAAGVVRGAPWRWAPANGRYETATQATPLGGLWVYCTGDLTLAARGLRGSGRATLLPGWNLLGPSTFMPAPVDHPAVEDRIWAWDPASQAYVALAAGDWLAPGTAYWIRVRQACTLTLDE